MLDLYPGETVAVKTTKGIYKSKSVVLALGPWAAKFLPHIGLNLPLSVRLHLSGLRSVKQSVRRHLRTFVNFPFGCDSFQRTVASVYLNGGLY